VVEGGGAKPIGGPYSACLKWGSQVCRAYWSLTTSVSDGCRHGARVAG
jgi:hypothetical protein